MKPNCGHCGRNKSPNFIILPHIYVNCMLNHKKHPEWIGSIGNELMPRPATDISPPAYSADRWQYLSLEVSNKGVAWHPALSPSMSNVKCTQVPGKTQHDQLKQRGHKSASISPNDGIFWPSYIMTFRKIVTWLYGAELIMIVKPLM